jgi:hypothetical protein
MRALKRLTAAALAAAALLIAGCEAQGPQQRGVYMLLDTSGTYSQQLDKAERVIQYVLTRMKPGDSFAVARIDTGSFSGRDIIAKQTFDDRPSVANQQKRAFQKQVEDFLAGVDSSPYTDITGGLLQATEWLDEKGTGNKTVLIFSDLQEELEEGYNRDIQLNLRDYEVVALNVVKLQSDNRNPKRYLQRLKEWRKRVESSGGQWRVVNDLQRLDGILPPR